MTMPSNVRALSAAATKFGATLAELGLAQCRVAQWFGVSPRAVRRWRRGDRRAGRGVNIVLHLLATRAITVAQIEEAAASIPARDGGYSPPEKPPREAAVPLASLASFPAANRGKLLGRRPNERAENARTESVLSPAPIRGGVEPEPLAPLEEASQERSLRLAVKTPAPAALAHVEPTPADPGRTIGEKILALGPLSCRWCEGDPQHSSFFFCGAVTEKGSYCARHRGQVYLAQQAPSGGPSKLLRRFGYRLPSSSYEDTQAAPAVLSI
jgi:hypothetical protein